MIRLSSVLSSIYFTSALLASSSVVVAATAPWGVKMVGYLPRGGSSTGGSVDNYSSVCEEVKCSIIEAANKEVCFLNIM